jgi:AraC-like DNA-binding protein
VLDLPLIHADPVVRGVLVPSLPPPTASPGIVRRLAAVLDAAEAPSAVPAPSAARSLGLSERSLNRRLEEAGTSVRALRAEAVRRRAEALLSQGMAVGEVAQALGFATTSSFSRAWRRWTGTSPTRRKAER